MPEIRLFHRMVLSICCSVGRLAFILAPRTLFFDWAVMVILTMVDATGPVGVSMVEWRDVGCEMGDGG